jgi:hypothetical protein
VLSKIPYHNPLFLHGIASLVMGAGLDPTLKVDSSAGTWAGFQIFRGIDYVRFVEMPVIVAQRELDSAEISMENDNDRV